jgi:hypothetical protein
MRQQQALPGLLLPSTSLEHQVPERQQQVPGLSALMVAQLPQHLGQQCPLLSLHCRQQLGEGVKALQLLQVWIPGLLEVVVVVVVRSVAAPLDPGPLLLGLAAAC